MFKLIVLDSDRLKQHLWSMSLRSHQVCLATCAQDAMRFLENSGHVDLLMMDLDAPQCGGTEFVRYVRRLVRSVGLKILGFSYRADREFIQHAAKCGLSALMLKQQCDMPAVEHRIAQLLESPPAQRDVDQLADSQSPKSDVPTPQETTQSPLQPAEIDALLPKLCAAKALRPIVQQVMAMADNPNTDVGQLTRAIRNDVELTAKMIATANSAVYRRNCGAVTNLNDAVSLIGMKGTRELAMTLGLVDTFRSPMEEPPLSMEGLWGHSISCAHLCEKLADHLKVCDPNQVFIVGLLHDLGQRVLADHLPELYRMVLSRSPSDPADLCELERTCIGIDHAVLGAKILEQWGCPQVIVRAVRMHHHASLGSDQFTDPLAGILCVLALADAMAIAMGFEADSLESLPPISRAYLRTIPDPEGFLDRVQSSLSEMQALLMSRADINLKLPVSWPGTIEQVVLLGANRHPLEPLQLLLSQAYPTMQMNLPANARRDLTQTLILADLRHAEGPEEGAALLQTASRLTLPVQWPLLAIGPVAANEHPPDRPFAAISSPLRPSQMRQILGTLLGSR